MLAACLRAAGFDVVAAADGEAGHGDFDGVDLARAERYIVRASRPGGAPELIDAEHATGVADAECGDCALDQR